MNRKFFNDLSASTIQVLVNQALGLIVFLALSRYLLKEDYGEFNWSLAVLVFITSLLSLRLEQIVVSRTAAGEDASKLFNLFTAHVLFSGLFFYIVLLLSSYFFPLFFQKHNLLIILAISQLMTFFSLPFKQLANGKEEFRILAIMSLVANLVRAIGILLLLVFKEIGIRQVLLLYIISSMAELLICYQLSRARLNTYISLKYGWKDYILFVRSALPQVAVVFLNASIARIDWILLGLLSTSYITAEYSFAYKVYELSPFPLLILAPILLTRFSRFFRNKRDSELGQHREKIAFLVRMEMIAATLIPLLLNLVWSPLMDYLSYGKYGSVNETNFFILSCGIPFLYLNNLLWSLNFAQNKLRWILQVTLISFLIILVGNLILIPLMAAKGAALVYLLAIIVEFANYMRRSILSGFREIWFSLIGNIIAALAGGLTAYYLAGSVWGRLALGLSIYSLVLLATKQLRQNDLNNAFRVLKKDHN